MRTPKLFKKILDESNADWEQNKICDQDLEDIVKEQLQEALAIAELRIVELLSVCKVEIVLEIESVSIYVKAP